MLDLLNAIAHGKMQGDVAVAVLRSAVKSLQEIEAEAEPLRAAIVRAEQVLAYGLAGKPERDRLPSFVTRGSSPSYDQCGFPVNSAAATPSSPGGESAP